MTRLFALSLLVPLLQDPPDIAGDSPWKGFGVGSWVSRSRTQKQGDQIREATSKHTVAKIPKDGSPEMKVESNGKETLNLHLHGWAPRKEWLVTKGGGKLTIDGREFDCTTLQYAWEDAAAKIKGTATYWLAAEPLLPYREIALGGPDLALPPRALKLSFANSSPKAEVRVELEVRSLARKHKIGAKELSCIAEEGTVKDGPVEGSYQRLLSAEVPGGEVELVVAGTLKGAPIEVRQTTLDFKREP